ncbi:hypothetical protein EYF80_046942 [Liparis tanakae]|uniref:Uncharacterized protein n=1 Tax=Liparis tanakae TaxID=230148 RepID=A0A4Z2FPA3_9TELE|nr:hypothetical protein EYF80_046942 [Liparis tanakae]
MDGLSPFRRGCWWVRAVDGWVVVVGAVVGLAHQANWALFISGPGVPLATGEQASVVGGEQLLVGPGSGTACYRLVQVEALWDLNGWQFQGHQRSTGGCHSGLEDVTLLAPLLPVPVHHALATGGGLAERLQVQEKAALIFKTTPFLSASCLLRSCCFRLHRVVLGSAGGGGGGGGPLASTVGRCGPAAGAAASVVGGAAAGGTRVWEPPATGWSRLRPCGTPGWQYRGHQRSAGGCHLVPEDLTLLAPIPPIILS